MQLLFKVVWCAFWMWWTNISQYQQMWDVIFTPRWLPISSLLLTATEIWTPICQRDMNSMWTNSEKWPIKQCRPKAKKNSMPGNDGNSPSSKCHLCQRQTFHAGEWWQLPVNIIPPSSKEIQKGFSNGVWCAVAVPKGANESSGSTFARRSPKVSRHCSCPCMAPAQGWHTLEFPFSRFTVGPVDQAKRSVLHRLVSQKLIFSPQKRTF